MASPADSVARYYDSNTRRFLGVGGAGESHAIHRQLWGPDVHTTEAAAAHVHHLVTERVERFTGGTAPTVLDLGCGVGGTLLHLAELFDDARLHGITISRAQVEIAERLVARRGLSERVRVRLGDFHSARLDVEADIVVAIESFVHARSPAAFVASAAEQLAPNGRVILVDDFLDTEPAELSAPDRVVAERFRQGWRAPSLCTVAELTRVAAVHGLEPVEDLDLTGLIRLGRHRDRAIALATPLLRTLRLSGIPFFGNMVGGDALQRGLRGGLMSYRLVALQRAPTSCP